MGPVNGYILPDAEGFTNVLPGPSVHHSIWARGEIRAARPYSNAHGEHSLTVAAPAARLSHPPSWPWAMGIQACKPRERDCEDFEGIRGL